MTSRIPRALARRIDRLSRRAHRFHRLAHHPLCDEYGGEVVRLHRRRRTRLCRGCALAGAGCVAGLAAAALGRPTPVLVLAAAAVALALFGASLRWRGSKLVTRFAPGAALAFAAGCGLRAAALTLAAGLLLAAAYRRRGPDRSPCAACPERAAPAPCRGMAEMVRAERAFQRLAGRWIAAGPGVRPGPGPSPSPGPGPAVNGPRARAWPS